MWRFRTMVCIGQNWMRICLLRACSAGILGNFKNPHTGPRGSRRERRNHRNKGRVGSTSRPKIQARMRRLKECGASRPQSSIHFGAGTPNLLEAPSAADALPANLSLRLNFLPFQLGKGMSEKCKLPLTDRAGSVGCRVF